VTDLRRLQYFVAVAEERNFTRAAERLHIAQPALSRQIRLLEQELGTELLHRTTHAVELTEAGEYLLCRGPDLLSTAEDLWRSVRAYGDGERGAVVLAYGERQGVLMRRDHGLASRSHVGVAELGDDPLLMHPREANPGHYDAVITLCREHGVEPEIELRAMSFDLGYGPIQRHEAVAIVGESSRLGLPDELLWGSSRPR
jgi:DNA-binding transcriptional LysR family regulator